MASLMNATKWRALAAALTRTDRAGPKVRIKYLLEDRPCPGFSNLDWKWVKHGQSSVIEWLEIDPIARTFRGRLIPDKEEDKSEAIEAALKSVGVPFSIEGGRYRVWGYIKPGAQPTFESRSV